MRTLIWIPLRALGTSNLWRTSLSGRVRPDVHSRRALSLLGRWSAPAKGGDFFSEQDLPRKGPEDAPDETTILSKARRYGIKTLERLQFESSVNVTNRGGRLLDVYREDFDLWCICLDFQRLRFGDDGVKAVYHGMRNRCGKRFPFNGSHADHVWKAFIETGTRDLAFLRNICNFEVRSGGLRENFLVEVVGRLLEGESSPSARDIIRKIRGKHQASRDEIFHLFLCACRSSRETALDDFCHIYAALGPRMHLYQGIIDHLCHVDRTEEALAMHKRLISIWDFPQDFDALAPLVKVIAQKGSGLERFLRELEQAGASFEAQTWKLYGLERARVVGVSSGNLNIVASTTFGSQARRIVTDDFAARAFATRSLSFELILSGLRLLGLISVGPASIRELALSVDGPDALLNRFTKLQEVGVDTGASAYVRTIKQLAANGQATLLAAVVHTDQHADVFDDHELQRKLLINYYHAQDWAQINRTLAILNVGETNAKALERSANFLLQSALAVRDWDGIGVIMAKMRRDRQAVYLESVKAMQGLLSPRHAKFVQAAKREPDEIGFLIRIWQDVLKSGEPIWPGRWREPLRILGMLGRWDDLKSTALWIASWYSSRNMHGSVRQLQALNVLFDAKQQRAIISWAFISMETPSKQTLSSNLTNARKYPWIRGIELLRSLQDHGVIVHQGTVVQALLSRLRILFSIGGYSLLARNRRLRSWNSVTLEHYITTFYNAWMKPLKPHEKEHLIRNTLRSKRIRPRDALSIQLSKAWHERQEQREALAQRWRRRRARARVTAATHAAEPEVEPVEEVVMYRDIFTASAEDYKK